MTPAERNYDTHNKELLAIIRCFKEWRVFLLGYSQQIDIYSDHQNLTYFRQPQDLTRRQARWITYLQDYNFHILHCKGSLNKKADILSQQVDHDQGDNDDKEMIGLPAHFFATIYIVPKNCEEILQLHHDDPIAGHTGHDKMFEQISQSGTWETLQEDIATYTKGCITCQEGKPNRGKQTGQMHPHQISPYPWHMILIDIIGPLPESKGFNAIMTIVDKRTKHLIFVPTNTTMTSEGWAQILINNVFKCFGLPQIVISDRGSTFVSKFIKEWYKILGIRGYPTTAYHPRADKQTERMNQEVEIFL